MGPDAIPLWLPRPAYDGLGAHDVQPSLDAGLTVRPLAETTRDTLGWLDATPDAPVSGIALDRERELLAAWHARPPVRTLASWAAALSAPPRRTGRYVGRDRRAMTMASARLRGEVVR